MEVLFIGGLFPLNRRNEFIERSKGTIQFAADNYQWSFVKALDFYYDNLRIFSSPLLGNFPKTYNKVTVKSSNFSHNGKNSDYCIGSVRLPFLGLISKCLNLYSALLKNEVSTNPYLVVYSVHTPYLLAAVRYKKKFPQTKICLIVCDLPQFMSSNKNRIYTLLKKIDSIIINKLVKHVDSFVFFTDLMVSQFNIAEKPWIRIEGIYDSKIPLVNEIIETSDSNIVLYTGTLDSRYGILNLLDAFMSIKDPNFVLWICGDGNMKNTILEFSVKDSRIKYLGQLAHNEILSIQQKATVLVNPRPSEGEFTKYSFPSKTMEYLASGKPCIMNHLPGIPDEYLRHLFIPDDETSKRLANKIIEVCSLNREIIIQKGKESQKFILTEKSPENQGLKLYSLLEDSFNVHSEK
jgi:glycosyltransferase involved in cell wall biosynthesis